jgi:hypothetical protein
VKKSPSFDERLQRLDRIFTELERLSGKPKTASSSFSFQYFDRERVKLILRYYLTLSETDKGGIKDEQHIQDLERKKKSINALLQEDPPAWVTHPLREWRDDIISALRKQSGKNTITKGKCSLTKVITALGDYLLSVYALRAVFPSTADLHEYIRRILIEMTTPNCFLCGRTHRFTKWRNIWKRDLHTTTARAKQRKHEEKLEKQFPFFRFKLDPKN